MKRILTHSTGIGKKAVVSGQWSVVSGQKVGDES